MIFLLMPMAMALDAHGFSFEGVTGDVEDYARMGYPTAGVLGDGDISLILDYARDPLTEITAEGRVPVLSTLGTATLSGAFSFGAMRLEAALPVHPIGTDPAGSFSALGDARLGAMVPVPWMGPHIPLMALHTVVSFPTGSAEHFVSSDSFRFIGTGVVAQEFGPIGVIGTGGLVVSRPEEDRNLKSGLGPVLGLGTSFRAGERFSAALEFTGESEYGFSSFPVEASLSARYRAPLGAWATAGAATGLSSGVGASRWRLFIGAGWSFREENHRNLEPVVEVDDTSDRDQDGIVDLRDGCPDQPETVDTFEDGDGCPELDGDGDGVPFARDLCPTQPMHPEQDPRYSDGCPRVAELAGNRIIITETIFFREGRADLLPTSEHVLTAVRDLLQQNPGLGPILIEGHTNSNGSEAFNLRLSDARAYVVMNWLVDHGVEPARLISKGYGEARPLVAQTDPDAEMINRRVEFRVLSISDAPDGRQLALSPEALLARRKAAAGIVDVPVEAPKPEARSGRGKKKSSPAPAAEASVTPAPAAEVPAMPAPEAVPAAPVFEVPVSEVPTTPASAVPTTSAPEAVPAAAPAPEASPAAGPAPETVPAAPGSETPATPTGVPETAPAEKSPETPESPPAAATTESPAEAVPEKPAAEKAATEAAPQTRSSGRRATDSNDHH